MQLPCVGAKKKKKGVLFSLSYHFLSSCVVSVLSRNLFVVNTLSPQPCICCHFYCTNETLIHNHLQEQF